MAPRQAPAVAGDRLAGDAVVNLNRQSRQAVAEHGGQVVELGIFQRGSVSFSGAAGDGVELDELDLGAGGEQFGEAVEVRGELGVWNRVAVNVHEEGLDDQRALAAKVTDVGENFGQGNPGAVDELIVGLGAGIELGPDLIVLRIEESEALADTGAIEKGRVGDEHQLDIG